MVRLRFYLTSRSRGDRLGSAPGITAQYEVFWNRGLNNVCVCRDETQSYVQGFPGAKFKKFKTQPEAELWYRSNLPQPPVNPGPTTPTRTTSTVSSPNVISTSSSSTRATYASSNPSPMSVSRPSPQSISMVATTSTPRPIQPLRVAAPKNTTVDIVYSDGACKANGARGAVAGIGVWWGPNDPRYDRQFLPSFSSSTKLIWFVYQESIREMPRSADEQQS